MKLRSPAAWRIPQSVPRNPQSVPLEHTPGLRINKVFVAKGPAEPTIGSAEPTIGSYGTDPKPGEKGGFGLYWLRGTDNRFQRNRSVLRQVKRLEQILVPTPGLIYITKFKPGEAQAGRAKPLAAANRPVSRILQASFTCGGCEKTRFHNLRSFTCGGCERSRFHNLRNFTCAGCEGLRFQISISLALPSLFQVSSKSIQGFFRVSSRVLSNRFVDSLACCFEERATQAIKNVGK